MKKKKEQQTLKQIVYDIVWAFPGKYERGLLDKERIELFKLFKDKGYEIDPIYYSDALGCYTCEAIEGGFLVYRGDIITGITCGIEKRGINISEFD